MAGVLDAQFEKLIKGQAKYTSANLGMNLLISRLQRKYAQNATMEELKNGVQELNAFFERYSSIMAKEVDAVKAL